MLGRPGSTKTITSIHDPHVPMLLRPLVAFSSAALFSLWQCVIRHRSVNFFRAPLFRGAVVSGPTKPGKVVEHQFTGPHPPMTFSVVFGSRCGMRGSCHLAPLCTLWASGIVPAPPPLPSSKPTAHEGILSDLGRVEFCDLIAGWRPGRVNFEASGTKLGSYLTTVEGPVWSRAWSYTG